MASEKDKEHFRKIGEALNPPIQKITKEEWIKTVSFNEYVEWLCQGRELALSMRKARPLAPSSAEGAERAFKRAIQLGLVRYGKSTSSKSL